MGKPLQDSVPCWTIAYTHTRNRTVFNRWHKCSAMSWMNRHLHVQLNKLAALLWLVLLELIKIFPFLLVFIGLSTFYRSWRWIFNTVYQLYGFDGHFNHAIQLQIYHWELYKSWTKLRKEITWTQPFYVGVNLRKKKNQKSS